METIDLTTSGGVAAATLFLIELLKKLLIDFELKRKSWYPAILNLITLVVAVGVSLGAYAVILEETPGVGFDLHAALFNGLIAFFVTIGGYEPIVNILRGLKRKPNK